MALKGMGFYARYRVKMQYYGLQLQRCGIDTGPRTACAYIYEGIIMVYYILVLLNVGKHL
jgi:hypothetical protein